MQRVKRGDTVEVIAGKDLGERGEVLRVINKADRVLIDGINIVKRHEKARQAGQSTVPAQIIEKEAPVHLSNVMVVCTSCDKRTRIGYRLREDGHKTRFCKKCDANLD
ncbi:MAG: 50S ribosomal protein L24 [Aggregatilineales bacterium]